MKKKTDKNKYFNYSKFPMDTQECFLTYESFSYNIDEVRLAWTPIEKPVVELKKIQLPDYDLISIKTEKIDQVQTK